MKSFGCRLRTMERGSACGVGAPTCTSTTIAAVTATGAAECITIHSGQWSASLSVACRCATWTTASSAIRTRHITVTTGQEPDLEPDQAPRFFRVGVLDPVKQPSLSIKHTQG